MRRDCPSLPFEGEWLEAFGTPPTTGIWIVWGASGNGKSSFVMQLSKYLCRFFRRVAYDSLEEMLGLSVQQRIAQYSMEEVDDRFSIIAGESMEELSDRLKKRRAPEAVIIDSLQYSGMTYNDYKKFKERHRDKLIIFISHAEGTNPEGKVAKKVMFDADVKIMVQGFRAVCKGRFISKPGKYYTIWEEGAAQYWNSQDKEETEQQS
jgi:hypothetical protein